jgi:hypothetical protein
MGPSTMPLIYMAIALPILGIIYSLFSPLPAWGFLIIAIYIFTMVAKIISGSLKFKRPKLIIDNKKHRKLLVFSLFFCIFTIFHAWYLTKGGSLYEPGIKYKNYVSATKEGIKFIYEDAASFYFAKCAVDRSVCAIVLLAVVLSFSLRIGEKIE